MTEDGLCFRCAQLDLPTLFRTGHSSFAEERKVEQPDTVPLALGTLSEAASRHQCPFCQICSCVLSDFAPLITSDFRLLLSDNKEIDIFHVTAPVDEFGGEELVCHPYAGPPVWYIKILSLKSGDDFYSLRNGFSLYYDWRVIITCCLPLILTSFACSFGRNPRDPSSLLTFASPHPHPCSPILTTPSPLANRF